MEEVKKWREDIKWKQKFLTVNFMIPNARS
jgi:hypothetical protein